MWKRCVFKSLLKEIKEVAILSSRGRAFHKRGAEAANVRSSFVYLFYAHVTVSDFIFMRTVVYHVDWKDFRYWRGCVAKILLHLSFTMRRCPCSLKPGLHFERKSTAHFAHLGRVFSATNADLRRRDRSGAECKHSYNTPSFSRGCWIVIG